MPTKEELLHYLNIMNRKEISDIFQVSESTVSRWLKAHQLCRQGWGAGKMTYGTAQEIRKFYTSKQYTQKELAKKYKVSQSTISKIINNQSHKSEKLISGEAVVKLTVNL
jgi:transposase